MNNDIIYITVENNGETLYRAYHKSFFDNAIAVGESVVDMYETLSASEHVCERTHDDVHKEIVEDERSRDYAIDEQVF